jgi:hypothetical protein
MGEDLLKAINPQAQFVEGETIFVSDLGADKNGKAVRVEVDKTKGQLRAYADNGSLLVAYPATIGSEPNPSPSGTHTVKTVVINPDYTYNPKVNFQQGDNDKVSTLPPGPNGTVGTVWIDLSEPTSGIHVDACQIDVFPTQRRNMLEHVIGNDAAFLTQVLRGSAEVNGVPVDDCADDEIEAGRPKRLAFQTNDHEFHHAREKGQPT